MAEETVTIQGTTKTDPKEASARQKWQDEVSSQLNSDAISNAMFVNQMKTSFDKQDRYYTSMVRGKDMSNQLLQSVETNTFRTANLFADYLDFIKDVERKRAEAAMEAARKKDQKTGGDSDLTTEKMDSTWATLGGIMAGTLGAIGAGFLAFKDKWGGFFTTAGNQLKDMDKPKAGFFTSLKKFFGFGDNAKDIKDLGKARSGFFFKLGKYFGFNQAFPDELAKQKSGFFKSISKFLKFGDDAEGLASTKKGNFTKALNRMMTWAGDTEKLTDANKSKFFKTQGNMLKWLDTSEDMTDIAKKDFLSKQSKMLRWVTEHTEGMDKSKIKFLKDQSKMLAFAEDAEGLSNKAKIKFLKKHSNILDIGEGAIDSSKVAKDSFFAKQLKMLGLNPADVDGVELKKQGMFSKLKGKIFNIGDDVGEAITKAKTGMSTKMTNFFKMPMFAPDSNLMKFKTGFLTSMENMLGTLWKVTKGFFKLVNVMNFGTLGFLNAEALAKPVETFKSIKASTGVAFGPEGVFTKIGKTFKAIVAPLGDWMKPIGKILKVVKTIGKIFGRIFVPLGILFGAIDVITNVVKGYEEGGIAGAIGAGVESIFDDIIMFIPNLLGEAVAWVLKKMGFDNAVKFIDENLRDADGNFSLFNGIKNLFSMIGDVIADIWKKVTNYLTIDNIMTMMGADLIKRGHTTVAGMLLTDKLEDRAKLRAKSEESYQALVAQERAKEELKEKERERLAEKREAAVMDTRDQSQNITQTITPQIIPLKTDFQNDPLKKNSK